MLRLIRSTLPLALLLLAAGALYADNSGQEDLDKATELKLNATTISDLSEVIRLVDSAMEKGLDEGNTEFANRLLASTLLLRARETGKQLRGDADSIDELFKRRDFAISDLERSVKLDPKQPETYLLIAQLNLLPRGDAAKAKDAISQALSLGFEDPSLQSKALLIRATLEEDPEKKLPDLDEAVKLAPDDAAPVRARGLLKADMGQFEPALADLNKAIELEPNDGPAYEAVAIILTRLNRFDEALAVLDKAQQINPDSLAPLLQRARVHSTQENLDAALEDMNQALAKAPDNVIVLLMRANLHEAKGNREKAMADVDEALKLKPDLPVAVRTRAVLLAEDKKYDEAIAELQKILKLDPKDTLTLMQLAVLYGAQKKSDEAIDAYTKLLEIAPDEASALRGRGDVYLNAGRQADAVADYEKALKIDPKDFGVMNNLAWVLATSTDEKMRNGKQAVELATQACEQTEYKLAYILSTLAAAYAECGDFENAVKWSSKAVEIGDKDHAESLEKELENYKAGKPWREDLTAEKPADQ